MPKPTELSNLAAGLRLPSTMLWTEISVLGSSLLVRRELETEAPSLSLFSSSAERALYGCDRLTPLCCILSRRGEPSRRFVDLESGLEMDWWEDII